MPRKRKRIPIQRRRRGSFANLLPAEFIAEMVMLPVSSVEKDLYAYCRLKNKKSYELSPRQIARYVEYCYEERKINLANDVASLGDRAFTDGL